MRFDSPWLMVVVFLALSFGVATGRSVRDWYVAAGWQTLVF